MCDDISEMKVDEEEIKYSKNFKVKKKNLELKLKKFRE